MGRTAWPEVTDKTPCPACGHDRRCKMAPDGNAVRCFRTAEPPAGWRVHKTHSDGGATFMQLGATAKPRRSQRAKAVAAAAPPPKLSPEQLDHGYRTLIEKLGKMVVSHKMQLTRRGMPQEEVDRRQYGYMPSPSGRARIAAELAEELGGDFAAVPGFGFIEGKPAIHGATGILIPIRNAREQIIGMLIRAEGKVAERNKYLLLSSNKKGGNSPGSPAHVPLGVKAPCEVVRIVEGHLKADVVTALDGSTPTISCGGVSMYRRGIEQAKELGATTIRWAFDADAPAKEEVATALLAAIRATLKETLTVELERWPIEDGKGLDDLLHSGKKPELLIGEAALEAAIEIAKAAGVDPGAGAASGDEILDRVRDALVDGDVPGFFCNADLINAIAKVGATNRPIFSAIRALASQLGVPMRDFDGALKNLIRLAAKENTAELARDDSGGFFENGGCICRERLTVDGPLTIAMCNFTCAIDREVALDNGNEVEIVFEISGKLNDGRPLPKTQVSAEKFAELKWIGPAWGSDAIVWPNEARALPAAIQALSRSGHEASGVAKVRHTKYTHTGWRTVGGRPVYLHAGGMITGDNSSDSSNVSVELFWPLSEYKLPDPPAGEVLISAIRATMDILTVTSERITFPILSAVFRSVLGACDFSVSLVGPTGNGKSELAALCQQHFGAYFVRKFLPANWSSTANSIERLAFLAKDALLVVDDFAPNGSPQEVQRFHREAERVFRAQGNNAGRGRMGRDGRLQRATPPRGLIMSTAEDLPRGQSIRARQLIIEVSPGDVELPRLTPHQDAAAAGVYTTTMAGFLAWIAPKFDRVQKTMAESIPRLREEAASSGQHARTPGIVAELAFGFRLFLKFAESVRAISAEERDRLWHQNWLWLLRAADEQEIHQTASDPARQFTRLLGSALATGRVHLADADGDSRPEGCEAFGWRLDPTTKEWRPHGKLIGWASAEHVFLDPPAAIAEIQRFAAEQGTAIPVGEHVLRKMLYAKGLLARTEQQKRGTLTIRRTIDGINRQVLCMFREVVATGAQDLPKLTNGKDGHDSEQSMSAPIATSVDHKISPAPAHNGAVPPGQYGGNGQSNGDFWQVGDENWQVQPDNPTKDPTTKTSAIAAQKSDIGSLGGQNAPYDTPSGFKEENNYMFDGSAGG